MISAPAKKHYDRLLHGDKPLSEHEFSQYSAEDKRRIIAVDALYAIELEIATAQSGTYISFEYYHYNLCQKPVTTALMVENKIECHVCAKGALFLGHIMARNDRTFIQVDNNYSQVRLLSVFNEATLNSLECYFEGDSYIECNIRCLRNGKKSEAISDIMDMFHKFSDHDRLCMLLENIILYGNFNKQALHRKIRDKSSKLNAYKKAI